MTRPSAFLALLLTILLAGCASNEEATTTPPLIIGGVFGLSGGDESLDIPSRNGAQLAVDQINASGGLLGRQIELQVIDCKSDSADAAKDVNELAANADGNIIGYVGLSDSDPAVGAGKAATALVLPFVTSGATLPTLPEITGRSMFLACFGDNVQAAAGAEFAYDSLKKRSVFILQNSTALYTVNLARYFRARWLELAGAGGIAGEASYVEGASSISGQAAQIAAAQPDFVYASSMPEDLAVVTAQLRSTGVTCPIVGGDGWDTPALLAMSPTITDSVYYSTHAYVDSAFSPAMRSFISSYRSAVGNPPENAFAALGYDAVMLLASAVRKANDINDPLSTIRALEATENFEGITGSISFTSFSHVPRKTVTMIGVMHGAPRLAGAFVPKKVPVP